MQCTATVPAGIGTKTPTMQCHTQWCHLALELLQCTVTLQGAVGCGTPAMKYHTTWELCAVEILQCSATLPAVKPCNALPQCLKALGSGPSTALPHQSAGSGQWNTCHIASVQLAGVFLNALPHCRSGIGQRAIQLPQCTTTLLGGNGQWNTCNAPPHLLWVASTGSPAMHCQSAWRHWAMELLECTTTLLGGSV